MRRKITMLLIALVISVQPIISFAAPAAEQPYKTNSQGQTYGVVAELTNAAEDPDLIYALAANGKYGYIKNEDLLNCGPLSPDDTDYEVRIFGNKNYCAIPVYEQDGTTVIGEFHIEKSETPSSAARATFDPRSGYTQGAQCYIGVVNGIEYFYQNLKKVSGSYTIKARTLVEHTYTGTVAKNTYGVQARIININDAVVKTSAWAMNSAETGPGYVYADTSYTSTSSLYYSYGLAKEWNGESYWIHVGASV